jgi:hypothetical protein
MKGYIALDLHSHEFSFQGMWSLKKIFSHIQVQGETWWTYLNEPTQQSLVKPSQTNQPILDTRHLASLKLTTFNTTKPENQSAMIISQVTLSEG